MMKTSSLIVFSVLLLAVITTVNARSQPVCAYQNTKEEFIVLRYWSSIQKGDDYVDYSSDGHCLKRAVCTETYAVDVEECSKYQVTCENKDQFSGVFPACCVQC